MRIAYCLLLITLLGSCVKDKPQEPVKTAVSINSDTKVLIINEGNYGWNNASVSVYDPASGNAIENYYAQQNNQAVLGDVCQSICKYNNAYYIVVNNSGKIEKVNASDFSKTATITGFTSPRYMLPVTYQKAYVTDLYANSIQIVNLNTNTITGSIPCSGWTESMAMIYNKVFVTNVSSDYCYIIDAATDHITDSILVGKGTASIQIDRNDKVWILSSGSSSNAIAGNLCRINPFTLQKELNLGFSQGESPQKLCINKNRDELYYLNGGVFKMSISSAQLPGTAFINQGSKVFYGLGINPADNSVYVSDVIDYVQKSKIELYDVDGNYLSGFNAGIISSGFGFE